MNDVTPPAAGQGGESSWMDAFGDHQKSYVENKGWKEPSDLLSSYQNLEKLHGVPADQILRLPDDPAKDGAMDGVWSKLGRPEAPDKYTRAVDEAFNDDVYKQISATAHKHGVSDTAFKALQEHMTGLAADVLKTKDDESATKFDEWKSANAEGFQNAAKVMATVGVNEEQLAGILDGDKASLYDFLAKVGARSQESRVVNGEDSGGQFDITPNAAKQKIAELMGDKDFMSKYTSPNQRVRQPAIDRLSRLHQIAAKEQQQ